MQETLNHQSKGNKNTACFKIERRNDLRLAVVVPYRDRADHLNVLCR